MFRSDRLQLQEGEGRSAEQSAHRIMYYVYILCSGQTDRKKFKAGLQSSQHTVLCLYMAFRSDRREEVKGRSAEQSARSIVFVYGVQVRQT